MKITPEGNIWLRFSFPDIDSSTTAPLVAEIMAFVPAIKGDIKLLEQEFLKVKYVLDVRVGDEVEVVEGEYKGVCGVLVEKMPRMFRIRYNEHKSEYDGIIFD
jgi:transcription elongation factor